MTPKTLFLLSELAKTDLNGIQQALLELILEEMQNTQITNIKE